MFGTFVGLTAAVAELSGLFIEMDISALMENAGIQTLIRKLIGSLEGMSVAFVTSLVGVGCSIILTILLTIFSAEEARENLMVQIEEYLDNVVALLYHRIRNRIFNHEKFTTLKLYGVGDRIQTSLQKTVRNLEIS